MTFATEEDLREQIAYRDDIIKALTGWGEARLPRLTKLESRIVRTLEKANGGILSKGKIVEGIYFDRPNGPPGENIIPVFIGRIRSKRSDIGKRIFNESGCGYRLVPA